MMHLYGAIGITRQGFHKRLDRHLRFMDEAQQVRRLIGQIRLDHPELGARQLYFMIKPGFMGRDKFEAFCFENGFRVVRKRSFTRTTNSLGVTRFENLLAGRELTGVNQVWVSDITYYQIEERYYYLTFIMDLYSRYIVGYSASENLLTENTTIPALRMALGRRKVEPGLILHSDGGGQYYCKEFRELTTHHQIRNSMGKTAYENPNAERVNGTIKNSYLRHYYPQNFRELKNELARAVRNYNKRPHQSLNRISPKQFDKQYTRASS
ncbi:MAG: IS3 family transposase [Clostridia bacterium]|jgi:putative transposase